MKLKLKGARPIPLKERIETAWEESQAEFAARCAASRLELEAEAWERQAPARAEFFRTEALRSFYG